MCLHSAEPKLINSAGPSLAPCRAAQMSCAVRSGACSLLEDTLASSFYCYHYYSDDPEHPHCSTTDNVEETESKQPILLQKLVEDTYRFCLVDDFHKFSVFRLSSKLGK